MCAALKAFVRTVANSPLKIALLTHLWHTRGVFTDTTELANRLNRDPAAVRTAVRELADADALDYDANSFFGFADLCFLVETPQRQRTVGALAEAMTRDRGRIHQ